MLRVNLWRMPMVLAALCVCMVLLAGCAVTVTAATRTTDATAPATCAAQTTTTAMPGTAAATALPDHAHFVRAIVGWFTNGGKTPAPKPLDLTNTNAKCVQQFYQYTRSLPWVNYANAISNCPAAFGTVATTITFFRGATTILHTQITKDGCVFVTLDGMPKNTYLQVDQRFWDDLSGFLGDAASGW